MGASQEHMRVLAGSSPLLIGHDLKYLSRLSRTQHIGVLGIRATVSYDGLGKDQYLEY